MSRVVALGAAAAIIAAAGAALSAGEILRSNPFVHVATSSATAAEVGATA